MNEYEKTLPPNAGQFERLMERLIMSINRLAIIGVWIALMLAFK